jgi:alpha 1,2-mannosyltransferase
MFKRLTPECVRKIPFQSSNEEIKLLQEQWQDYAKKITPYPANFSGQGIVMCAGGMKYFTCAWVSLHMLRKKGCTLPVEIWYNGTELSREIIYELEKTEGVKCRNCVDYSTESVDGFMMKPFAILNSSFKHVLYLDADNNCMTDPSFLFDSEEYKEYGAVFWPDLWTTENTNPIWKIIGSEDFDSIEQESGQILINKEMCWKELNLCLYFNLNNDYYYKILMGDKDTFKFAWMALRSPYYMMSTSVGFCGLNDADKGFFGLSMVQHDFNGNIIFLHRNLIKWDITLNDELVWQDIRRFTPGTKNRIYVEKLLSVSNYQHPTVDIMGDVETSSFKEMFGDYESECQDVLKKLRKTDFYNQFLFYTYLVYFRAGYK